MSKKLSLEEKIANQKARLAKLESLKSQKVIHENVVLKELPENKIKVGDRVIAVESIGNQLTKNKIYIVTNVDGKYGDISVTMNDGNEGYFLNYRFKLAPKEEMKIEEKKVITVKPGDFVVCNDKGGGDGFVFGNVYFCNNSTTPDHVCVDKDSIGRQNGWNSIFFRFATNDEIYQYLLKQANNKGIKIGAMMKDKTDSSIRFKIESFDLITKSDIKNQSIKVKNYFDKFQRPFLACACPVFQIPVDLVEVVDEQKELFDRLVKEANDKGFVKNVKFKYENLFGTIDDFILITKDNVDQFSGYVSGHWSLNKKPFLAIRFNNKFSSVPVDGSELYDEKKEAAKIRADLEAKMIKEANDR